MHIPEGTGIQADSKCLTVYESRYHDSNRI